MAVPTISELYNSVLADLKNRLQTNTIIGKAFLNGFAAVQAGKLKIFYLTIENVRKNIFVDQADNDTIIRYGLVKLERLPFPATAGEYTMQVSGEVGAQIPSGTTFRTVDASSNPGVIVQLDSVFTFIAASGEITVRALELGSDYVLQLGDQLQLTAPIANVDSFGNITSVVTTPTNEEDIEEYRDKVIEAYRSEPQGGARVDYRVWTDEVPGRKQVYPYVKTTESGVVELYVEATAEDSTDGNGTPSSSLLDDVKNAIEPDKRPMGTFRIDYLPISTNAVDLNIFNLSDASLLSSIEGAIADFLLTVRPFIDGADNVNERNDKLFESEIYNIVRNVIGTTNTFDNLEMLVNSTSVDVYTFDGGNIPYLNSVNLI